jgi:hypothetical protein
VVSAKRGSPVLSDGRGPSSPPPGHQQLPSGAAEIVTILVEAGADRNAGQKGHTPLEAVKRWTRGGRMWVLQNHSTLRAQGRAMGAGGGTGNRERGGHQLGSACARNAPATRAKLAGPSEEGRRCGQGARIK